MNELLALLTFFSMTAGISLTWLHVKEYQHLFHLLDKRGVAYDLWRPTFFTSSSSWGYYFKLQDIERTIGKTNLTDEELVHLENSKTKQKHAYLVIIGWMLVTILAVFAWQL